MFGPREVLLTSDHPVITQFVNGRRVGPIGMSEEKDEATLALELQEANGNGQAQPPALVPQLTPTAGLPERQAAGRRMARVMSMLATLPAPAQQAIIASLPPGERTPRGLPGEEPGAASEPGGDPS
jgi:phospholipid/cholesterol/gamma-HCH transport system ATP-binding protein